MKGKNIFYTMIVAALVFAVSGCSTVPKKYTEEMSGLKTKVDTLETRVGEMEAKQSSEQSLTAEDTTGQQMSGTNFSTKSSAGKTGARMRDIQSRLKNAGYYDGEIDGVKGKNTKKAIKEFQKANGLTADGVVGKKTWEALDKYAQGTTGAATTK
ncbi:MAG: peptidoglycan-binding domain-containing protein [Candidatus Omnitrophota bacterium]|jgi:peptidoglycan hydrolase-like protein with peptidoglycan-binding domain